MQWNGSRYSEDVERYIFNQIAHVGVDPKSCQHVRWMINGAVIAVYFQIAIGCVHRWINGRFLEKTFPLILTWAIWAVTIRIVGLLCEAVVDQTNP
jgi:hypothetical protein